MESIVEAAWKCARMDNIEELQTYVPSKISADACIHSDSVHIHSLLSCAAAHGAERCTAYLLKEKANPNKKNFAGYTPLHWAAYTGRTECVKQIVEAGGDIEAKTVDGNTPLHIAASRGHQAFIQFIEKLGANLEAVNSIGWTAVHFALIGNHRSIITYLESKGVNYDMPDANMKDIRSIAEQYGRTWFTSSH